MNQTDFDITLSFDPAIADREIEWLPGRIAADDPHLPNACSSEWSVVPTDVRDLLVASQPAPFDSGLHVFRLAEQSRAELDVFMAWQRTQRRYDLDAFRAQLDSSALIRHNFTTLPEAQHFLGLARMSGGRNTTTRDKENRIVGLHLDTFDKAPMERRCEARNRIAINVGTDGRYLLFVPCTAWRLVEIARREGYDWSETALLDHRVFVRSFFHDVRPPVFRVRIEPGEGYLAPTENMLHDGSTFSSSAEDLTLVWLGYFRRLSTTGR
ncbi:hypothetical protein HW571_28650 [Agrobacterium genomosp. 3]|uniref:hypothetical protein n=1 Tax=Agrobacterium tomkonis TaxID=1183410 RepID=UPI001CD8C338|nr:hypothetical protein [Agrobacterium tomkonis]MCA1879917.1 hypothetical protein [Agrobacterium tumefaciens]MCA1895163.1 hypothetical protein [Agrobacterium tomkonis]